MRQIERKLVGVGVGNACEASADRRSVCVQRGPRYVHHWLTRVVEPSWHAW